MEEQWWYAIALANSDVIIAWYSFRTIIVQVQNRTDSELVGALIYSGNQRV